FAALRVWDPHPVQEMRVRTWDYFQLFEPRVKTMRPVTIVDIDEKSLADPRLGQWPWPRTRIADIVTNLTKLGAAVIAFDVVFSEPDRLNPDIAADTFRNLDEATREKLRALPSNDQIFADAIRQSRVVLGESGGPDVHALDMNLPVTGLAMLGEEPQPFMYKFPGLLRNVEVLEKAAAGRARGPVPPPPRPRALRAPRAYAHGGAGHPHPVAALREAARPLGPRHDPDQGRQGRHPECRRPRLPRPARRQRPALGALSPP